MESVRKWPFGAVQQVRCPSHSGLVAVGIMVPIAARCPREVV